MHTPEPAVTVVIFAYNHEKYIREAIASVAAQSAPFGIELVVFYTASSDGTQAAIEEAVAPLPWARWVHLEKGRPFFDNTAGWMAGQSVQGKYITLLEGDDYWTYPFKLKEMVEYMEAEPAYSGIFHDAEIVSEPSDSVPSVGTFAYYRQYRSFSQFNTYRADYFPWDAVSRTIIPPGTLLVRTAVLRERLSEIIRVEHSGGWMMSLFWLKYSKFRYVNACWSVYRNHNKGITKTAPHSAFIKANIRVLKALITDDYYKNIKWDIHKSIAREYEHILHSPDMRGAGKLRRLKTVYRMYAHWTKYACYTAGRVWRNEI